MLKSPYSARLFSENIRRRLIIATLMLQYSHKWTGIACSNFLPFLYFQQSSLSVLANLSWRRRLLGNLSIVSHLTWTVVSARCLSLILTLLCPSGSTSLSKMYRICLKNFVPLQTTKYQFNCCWEKSLKTWCIAPPTFRTTVPSAEM